MGKRSAGILRGQEGFGIPLIIWMPVTLLIILLGVWIWSLSALENSGGDFNVGKHVEELSGFNVPVTIITREPPPR